MTKVLILNDLHVGESRESSTHPGIIRQANSETSAVLESYIPKFNQTKYDLIINLGDVIRDTGDVYTDTQLLETSLSLFNKIDGEKVFIPGNHEYKEMGETDILQVMRNVGLSNDLNGSIILDGVQFIWIKSEIGERDLASLSEETLLWLDQTIKLDLPIVLFSHYSAVPLDGKDNFYFGGDDYEYMCYTNSKELLTILGTCKSVVTINAHTHMSTYKTVKNIQSISALSFCENFSALKYPDANPGIYSELEITDNKKIFRSYSGDFCFLNAEL
jgi:3',5'-cyclic AMP phosphodiesterase CpdA